MTWLVWRHYRNSGPDYTGHTGRWLAVVLRMTGLNMAHTFQQSGLNEGS